MKLLQTPSKYDRKKEKEKETYIQTISGMRKTISTENKEYDKLYSY